MGMEIERKFLVRELPDLNGIVGEPMVQGYLGADAGTTVRVRVAGERAWLTVKGPSRKHARLEFEYAIPADDARTMLRELPVDGYVEKVRYRIEHAGHLWELDVFSGRNAGLVLAEVELDRVGEEPPLPSWVGREVSEDSRFFNSRLAQRPYQDWGDEPLSG